MLSLDSEIIPLSHSFVFFLQFLRDPRMPATREQTPGVHGCDICNLLHFLPISLPPALPLMLFFSGIEFSLSQHYVRLLIFAMHTNAAVLKKKISKTRVSKKKCCNLTFLSTEILFRSSLELKFSGTVIIILPQRPSTMNEDNKSFVPLQEPHLSQSS